MSETYHPWINLSAGLLVVCWAARWTRTRTLSRPTPIDVPVVLFIISALVALWAAPNRPAGLVRLYLILAAVTFFYTLVNSDLISLKIFSSVFIVFAGFMGIFLASQYDWAQSSARFQLIKETGIWLNRVIPNLRLSLPHRNVIRNISASLMAVSLPVALLVLFAGVRKTKRSRNITVISWRKSSSINYWIAGLSLASITFGLILTESRTPWVFFGVIFILWIWWRLSGSINSRLPLSQIYIFLISLGIAFALVGMVVIRQPQFISSITDIAGPKDFLNRGEIYPQSWRLAQDTPFTGGGLAAFPALYSTYMRVIPYNAFLNEDTGNNAYLNLLVEQGWLGVLSYIVLLLVALSVAIGRFGQVENGYRSFVIAGVLGIGFILVQGFVHATLVATRALPFLLIPAGLALSGIENHHITPSSDVWEHRVTTSPSHQSRRTWKVAFVVVLLIIFSALIFIFRNTLLSAWYADLGVIQMSQTELSDFPSGQWDNGSQVAALNPAEKLFKKALRYNPNNRTTNHRLGLIAMQRYDFHSAIDNLENAHQLDPTHRGIRKNLGYSYVWVGQPDLAAPLLVEIPEAKDEMGVYVWWWETQSRPDLSAQAENATTLLGEK
jgi:O-antigen ligase